MEYTEAALPLPCTIVNKNRRVKNGVGLGMRLELSMAAKSVQFPGL